MIVSKSLFSALLASAVVVSVVALPQGGGETSPAPTSSAAMTSSSEASPTSSAPGGSETGGGGSQPGGGAGGGPIPVPSGTPLPPEQAQFNVTALTMDNGQPTVQCWNIKEEIQGAVTESGPVVTYTYDADGNGSFALFPPGFSTQLEAMRPYWVTIGTGQVEVSTGSSNGSEGGGGQGGGGQGGGGQGGGGQGGGDQGGGGNTVSLSPEQFGLLFVNGSSDMPLPYNVNFTGQNITSMIVSGADNTPQASVLHPGQCTPEESLGGMASGGMGGGGMGGGGEGGGGGGGEGGGGGGEGGGGGGEGGGSPSESAPAPTGSA